MTPEQARRIARQLEDEILANEAEMTAAGWRFLTVAPPWLSSVACNAARRRVASHF